jgi:hypothetical protein
LYWYVLFVVFSSRDLFLFFLECDEPGHEADSCPFKMGVAQGTHNSVFMAQFTEDDIPEGETKETYMFKEDKAREELLFTAQLAGLDFSNYSKFKVDIEGEKVSFFFFLKSLFHLILSFLI